MSGVNANAILESETPQALVKPRFSAGLQLRFGKYTSIISPQALTLMGKFSNVDTTTIQFSFNLQKASEFYMNDHKIIGKRIVPATTMMELFYYVYSSLSLKKCGYLYELSILSPKLLGNEFEIHADLDGKTGIITLATKAAQNGNHQIHAKTEFGEEIHMKSSITGKLDLANEPINTCKTAILQKNKNLLRSYNFAHLDFPKETLMDNGYAIYPAKSDAALHLAAVCLTPKVPPCNVPTGFKSIWIHWPSCKMEWVHSECFSSKEDRKGIDIVLQGSNAELGRGRDPRFLVSEMVTRIVQKLPLKEVGKNSNKISLNENIIYTTVLQSDFPLLNKENLRPLLSDIIYVQGDARLTPKQWTDPIDAASYIASILNIKEKFNIEKLQAIIRQDCTLSAQSCHLSVRGCVYSAFAKGIALEHPDNDFELSFSDQVSDLEFNTLSYVKKIKSGGQISCGLSFRAQILESESKGNANYICVLPKVAGSLSQLDMRKFQSPKSLGLEESLVAVKSIGLNFRDVLILLGVYPASSDGPGSDFSGVVMDSRSEKLMMGDRVFGLCNGCMGSHTVIKNSLVIPVPKSVSFEEAASIPTIFLTALVCFESCWNHGADSFLMIHGASGGFGLAALQFIANISKFTIFGTASSPSKRSFVRRSGCHCLDSRSTNFVETMAIFKSQGSSSVINSLTSPGMIAANLSCLSKGGIFVEVGKRDIWSHARVAQERADIVYSVVAIDLLEDSSKKIKLERIAELVSLDKIKAVHLEEYNLSDTAYAVRKLATARHIGKLIISPSIIDSDYGKWVITGGWGALGQAATGLVSTTLGVQSCVIIGRTGRSSNTNCEVKNHGAEIISIMCDISKGTELKQLFIKNREREWHGFLHAGGLVKDSAIYNQNPEILRAVVSPKLGGTNRTDVVLEPIKVLKFFSSIVSSLGGIGQLNYSVANSILDFLAKNMSNLGLPAVSVNWGVWSGLGMASHLSLSRVSRLGIGYLTSQGGSEVMEAFLVNKILASNMDPLFIASPFNWQKLSEVEGPYNLIMTKFYGLENPSSKGKGMHGSKQGGIIAIQRSRKNDPAHLGFSNLEIGNKILTSVRSIIGFTIAPDAPLVQSGVDSLGAIELRNELASLFNISLPSTLVFDYPSVNSIQSYILKSIAMSDSSSKIANYIELKDQDDKANQRRVVLIDVRRRLPNNSKYFKSCDFIGIIPLDRWDVEDDSALNLKTNNIRFGGFITNWSKFDHRAFTISRLEAEIMDVQQRIMLEETSELVVHGTRTAVLVGVAKIHDSTSVSSAMKSWIKKRHGYLATARALSVIPGRISFMFNLQGPSVALDTACSSGLVALESAQHGIKSCDYERAVVAAVNVPMNAEMTAVFSSAGMLAYDGRCKTLDAAADGYVRSEGLVAFSLQHVTKQSPQNKDFPILAEIVSASVNQDGRSSSLTAPFGPSQQAAIFSALQKAFLRVGDLEGVEIHGTGTSLGDPIEIGALDGILKSDNSQKRIVCRIGTAKSQFGHAETVSGLIGVSFAIKALNLALCAPSMHLTSLNPYLKSTFNSCRALREVASNPSGKKIESQSTGVSAFAFQGTNVHAILQQGPKKELRRKHRFGALRESIRFWHLPDPHHMLNFSPSVQNKSCRYEIRLNHAKLSYLRDHIVASRSIIPASAILEVLLFATRRLHTFGQNGNEIMCLSRAILIKPLQIDKAKDVIHLNVNISLLGTISFDSTGINSSKYCDSLISLPVLGDLKHRRGVQNVLSRQLSISNTRILLINLHRSCSCPLAFSETVEEFSCAPSYVDSCFHLGAVLPKAPTEHALVPYSINIYDCDKDFILESGSLRMLYRQLKDFDSFELASSAYLLYANDGTGARIEGMSSRALNLGLTSRRLSTQADQFYLMSDEACFIHKQKWREISTNDDHHLSFCIGTTLYNLLLKGRNCKDIPAQIGNAAIPIKEIFSTFSLRKFTLAAKQNAQNYNKNCFNRFFVAAGVVPILKTVELEAEKEFVKGRWLNPYSTAACEYPNESIRGMPIISDGYVSFSQLKMTKNIVQSEKVHYLGFQKDSTCIITGWSGGLGNVVMDWLKAIGVGKNVILPSRKSKPIPTKFRNSSLTIRLHNIRDDAYQEHCTSKILLFHCSGALQDGLITTQDMHSIRHTMKPKIINLQGIFDKIIMHAIKTSVVFSSVVSMLGNKGQSNYAAANGVMDGWGSVVLSTGISISSIQWGPWKGIGMVTDPISKSLRARGVVLIEPYNGLSALESLVFLNTNFQRISLKPLLFSGVEILGHYLGIHLLGNKVVSNENRNPFNKDAKPGVDEVQSKILVSWESQKSKSVMLDRIIELFREITGYKINEVESFIEKGLDSTGVITLSNSIGEEVGVNLPATIAYDYPTPLELSSFVARVSKQDKSKYKYDISYTHKSLIERVSQIVSEVVGKSLEVNEPLMKSGLDSVGAVELQRQLEQSFRITVPATVAFDYPCIKDITTFVEAIYGETYSKIMTPRNVIVNLQPELSNREYIINAAFRYPPVIESMETFKFHIYSALDLNSEVSMDRWDIDQHYHPAGGPNRMYVRSGYWLQNIGSFDKYAFSLSSIDAITMDPQTRLLLQLSRECFGMTCTNSSTGVYIGCMYTEYLDGILQPVGIADSTSTSITGHGVSFMVGRLSYTFGFVGPCISTDTACSSSLVALHLARTVSQQLLYG